MVVLADPTKRLHVWQGSLRMFGMGWSAVVGNAHYARAMPCPILVQYV